MHPLIKRIKQAHSIILSTHSQPDGDGLGAQMALYWALKKIKKDVRIVNVDKAAPKYDFLDPHRVTETHDQLKKDLGKNDIALIFDTNDPELLLELWPDLKNSCRDIVFVDHHPILDRYPLKIDEHWIDINASSTGEIVFHLIKALQIPLDKNIALPIYSSIVFDTHYFRYIRGSSTPHLIVAELLRHDINPQKVHRHLFGNHSLNKLKYLAKILGLVEYELEGKLALIKIVKADLNKLGLHLDETRDIIDMVMNVESIEAAVLFREDAQDKFKVSFRSKGLFAVSEMAQKLGGGGHEFASGAYLKGTYDELKSKVLKLFEKSFAAYDKKAASE